MKQSFKDKIIKTDLRKNNIRIATYIFKILISEFKTKISPKVALKIIYIQNMCMCVAVYMYTHKTLREKIKVQINGALCPYSFIRRLNILQMSILHKFLSRFNIIPMSITSGFFLEIYKLILNFLRKHIVFRIAKRTLIKNTFRKFVGLPWALEYDIVLRIDMDQCNWIQSRNIFAYIKKLILEN